VSYLARALFLIVLGLGLGTVSGCNNDSAAHSEIIRQFQAAGGGDPDKADGQGIALFLNQRLPLDKQLAPLCNERAKTADAAWTTTGEGKICVTAIQLVAAANFFAPPPLKNTDHRTFSAVPTYQK
jgi:hypothetical protein